MANRFWVGGDGTWDSSSTSNWAATTGGASGASAPVAADNVFFDVNSGSGTCTTAIGAVCASITSTSTTITLKLGANLTTTAPCTFTSGAINLDNNTLTCTTFISSNSNVRSIDFGSSGQIQITGNATTVLSMGVATNFTYAGTSNFNLTYAGSTGTRNVRFGGTEINAPSIAISAGSDAVNISTARTKNLIFTGFTGSADFGSTVLIYGNLIISSGMTLVSSANATTFAATSGTQQITTNGKTIDFPIIQNGIGGTVQLQDNLTIGSTRTFTLTNGALDLSSGNRTLSTGVFNASNSNVRSIAFGTGNITLTGTGTIWTTATATNFSRTGTPTVNVSNNSATATTISTGAMTEAQSLNFNYTTGTYTLTDTAAVYKSVNFTGFAGTIPNSVRTIFGSLTLSAGMTLTAGANATTFASTSAGNTITTAGKTLDFPITFNGIGGTFAFQDALTQGSTRAFTITNGTVQLKDGVTTTVGIFAASSTSQKFLQSTLLGTQATLSQAAGTVSVSDLNIRDINAVGGASWNAYTDFENTDSGNNDGWNFSLSPPYVSYEPPIIIRSFTQPRRF
jgi:hypothetical protein